MIGFEDVTLGWKGEEFTVPADDVMMLICKIEDVLGEGGKQPIAVLMQNPPYGRLARAYAAALRHAGAKVTDAEVYLSIHTDLAEGKADAAAKIQAAQIGLLHIISPPVALGLAGDVDPDAEPEKG